MQKATPLILVLVLAATALFLALRTQPEAAASEVAAAVSEAAPAAESAPAPDRPAADGPPPGKSDASVATAEPRPWPQEESDIAPDQRAIFGELENGLRYIIYPNPEPPGRVSLRLHVDAGSLMEDDDQQGLAHFLEHMVFNGSRNFSAAELIPRMQRLGISFGAHANAYTSFDETVYMLDLPDVSEETLDLGFTVMRDFGDGALLEPEEIEKERGVILAEKRSRDSVSYRLMEQQFSELLPDSLLARRFPIGTEEVIREAGRERFVDFYTRYYTPRRMTFIVSGDIDPEKMKAEIEETFGSMGNPQEAGEEPEMGPIRQPEGLETAVFADREVAATDVSLTLVRPHVELPDTVENRLAKLPLNLAHAMISRRFERISEMENSPVASGSASRSELFNYLEIGSVDVTAADDRWQEAVPVLETEFRRAIEHGFTEAELEEAKSNLLNMYEQAARQVATRRSEGIATVLARTINDNTVFSSPETNLEIIRKGLEEIDISAAHAALRAFWEAPGLHLILTTKEEPENAEETLAALFEKSRDVPVEPLEAREVPEFAYTGFGDPGTIVSRAEVEDLGITQLTLSNQVRINLKPTPFEQDRIRLLARIGSGKLSQPADSPMLDAFAAAVFEGGGLGEHSNDDLRLILAGRNVSSSLSIGEDAFILSGSTTPADFPMQVRVMVASLTDPGFRNEGLWNFQKAIPMIYQQLRHTTAGPLQEMNAWLHGGDYRYRIAPLDKLTSYSIDDAKSWLMPELSKGYLELSVVGDFEIDAILPELLATFGALPPRADSVPPHEEARQVDFPEPPAERMFTYESAVPQGVATAVWKTPGIRDNIQQFRRLNILGEILGDRLREEIREKLGAAYSPNAGASGSEALEDFGYIIGQSACQPEDVQLILDTMRDLGREFADNGADDDEFDRAIKPTLGQLEKTLRDNTYWISTVMAQSQLDPERLELARNRDQDYRSITLEEINELAKKYLTADNALLVTIQSQNPKE